VEMKERLAAKRAAQAEQDKIDRKKNEQIRLKATKESQDIKEELQKKERIKEAQAKKREKQEEAEARKRVLAKLEADKAERKRKAEQEKAARAGQAAPAYAEPAAPAAPAAPKPAASYTEARLALQTPTGRITKTFPAETTLFEVAHALAADGLQVNSFTQNFPKKVFDQTEFGMTLKEAGMVPSAALIIK
jgi:UBX domain-containing protein 1/4